MLTHTWKKLGFQDPLSSKRNDHTPEKRHRKNQLAKKSDSLLKLSPMKASQAAAQRENEDYSSLNISGRKVIDTHLSKTSGLSDCHTDSDLSDQEQESIEMSKWAAAVELDLKPEPFDENLDHGSTENAFYPEVLPALLSVLDSTQNLSSEIQQTLFVNDPCLAPVIARLMELERLQDATVQKERAKLAQSRPATANTRNNNRLRKSDLPGCKTGISGNAECNSVIHSFTKLMVCPNSSCRCRDPNLPASQVSKRKSGKCKGTKSVLPTFSVSVKVQQKPTMPNRPKGSKTQKGSTSAKKTTVPNKKS